MDIFRGKHYAYVTLDLASVIVFVLFDSKAKIDFLSEKKYTILCLFTGQSVPVPNNYNAIPMTMIMTDYTV